MKTLKKITICIALAAVSFGCNESFLDQQPGSYVNDTQMAELSAQDPTLLLAFVDGQAYTTIISGTGGTDNHDDFGQKSIDLATDIMAGNVAMPASAYGWFTYAGALTGHNYTATATYKFWRYYFRIIKQSNELLNKLENKDKALPTDENQIVYWGQAKAMRAYAYYNLMQIYAGNYDEWKDKKVLPVYTTDNFMEPAAYSTLATVAAFAEADLTDAVSALDGYMRGGNKSAIDSNVAKGLLAYVKLYIGKYADAAQLSSEVMAAYPIMSAKEILETGFADQSLIHAWIWAVDVTRYNTGALATFWGHVDYFTYSYAFAGNAKVINRHLYSLISSTDTRKKWFSSNGLPLHKFYSKYYHDTYFALLAQGTDESKLLARRYLGGDRAWLNDVCFLRTEEMLLINAEANARLGGKETEAKAALASLLAERDTSADLTSLTGDALLTTIYNNWLIEMWAEGRALATMKRFKSSIKRSNNAYVLADQNIAYNDERLTYQVPEHEQTNNPLYGQ